jgi:hypothetical protein
MGVGLIVSRLQRNASISLEEWRSFLEAASDLRIQSEPYTAVNPKTGAKIQLPLGEADSEFFVDGQWLPFLRFARGRLVTEYRRELDVPTNELRLKISQVARHFGAVIGTDAGDDNLAW